MRVTISRVWMKPNIQTYNIGGRYLNRNMSDWVRLIWLRYEKKNKDSQTKHSWISLSFPTNTGLDSFRKFPFFHFSFFLNFFPQHIGFFFLETISSNEDNRAKHSWTPLSLPANTGFKFSQTISSNEERQAKHSWIPLSLPTNSGLFFPRQYLPMKINRPSTLGSPCFCQIPTGLSFPVFFFFNFFFPNTLGFFSWETISSNEDNRAKHSWTPLSLSTNSGLLFFSPSDKYLPMKINRPSTLGFPCFHQIPTGLSFPDNFFLLDWILIFFWIFWDTWTSSGISDRYITPSRTSPPPRLGEHLVDDHIDLAVAWSLTSPRTRTTNSITPRVV